MMDSVDKLRDYASRNQRVSGWMTALNRIADEIEREIAETEAFCRRVEEAARNNDELDVFGVAYMPLPTDADGVPIRLGDIMERVDGGPSQQACCICPQGFNDAPIWCARDFRHAKPRTLEDVLTDLAYTDPLHRYLDEHFDIIIGKYAAEIRELLGGDAE